jgi:membrane protein implicated in regulation of membrane protease activity
MKSSELFLLCFGVGSVWTLVTAILGGLHFGHSHGHVSHVHSGHGHVHQSHHVGHAQNSFAHWFGMLTNPSSIAVFLAWFGGIGFLLTRHTGLLFWIDVAIAVVFGLCGAWLLTAFLSFLQSREKPLDPADYEMVGVLGKTTSTIRPDGVGEVIYVRDGARRPVCARSEDGVPIRRGEEVVVVRFEKGIAYVRTWDAMLTQSGSSSY